VNSSDDGGLYEEDDEHASSWSAHKTWFILTGVILGLTLTITVVYAGGHLQYGPDHLHTCCPAAALADIRRCAASNVHARCVHRGDMPVNGSWDPHGGGQDPSLQNCRAQLNQTRLCLWPGGPDCGLRCEIASPQWDYNTLVASSLVLAWAFAGIMVAAVLVKRVRDAIADDGSSAGKGTIYTAHSSGGSVDGSVDDSVFDGEERLSLLPKQAPALLGAAACPRWLPRRCNSVPLAPLALALWIATLLLSGCIWAASENKKLGPSQIILSITACEVYTSFADVGIGNPDSAVAVTPTTNCDDKEPTHIDLSVTWQGSVAAPRQFDTNSPIGYRWDIRDELLCVSGNRTVVHGAVTSVVPYNRCVRGSNHTAQHVSYYVNTQDAPEPESFEYYYRLVLVTRR